MHCKDCEYPLWNLKARSCPECGRPFAPSDYEFVPNSVRFCCPQCDQEYYGTDDQGLLEPRAFECVQCGAPVDMDEMILRPAEGVEDVQTKADVMPWLDRGRTSVVKAWLRTVGRSMVSPGRLIRAVPVDSPLFAAWGYAAATVALIMLVGAGIPSVGFGLWLVITGRGSGTDPIVIGTWLTFGGTAGFLAVLLVWGLIVHGLLRLGGQVSHPIGRTYQCLCYSVGANVTTAVPCLGVYPLIGIGLVWWIVSSILMVAAGQRVSGARASFAVLVFPIAGLTLAAIGFIGLMFVGVSRARTVRATATAVTQDRETSLVVSGLLGHVAANDGAWPAHALELVRDESLTPWDFVSVDSATYLDAISVGGVTMEAFAGAPDDRRGEIIDTVIADLPARTTAYRLGDFVFCYPGVDPHGADALWVVVLAPDPEHNKQAAINDCIVVGLLNGEARVIPLAEFDARLAAQNTLRDAAGLPALPPPDSITHSAPVVGEEP